MADDTVQKSGSKPSVGQVLAGAMLGGIPKLFGYESVTPLDLILRKDDEERKGGMSLNSSKPTTDKPAMRKGGSVKKMAKGGSTASKRADGCATKGKTKGRFV